MAFGCPTKTIEHREYESFSRDDVNALWWYMMTCVGVRLHSMNTFWIVILILLTFYCISSKFWLVSFFTLITTAQGPCAIWHIPQKHILNSNLAKSRLPITYFAFFFNRFEQNFCTKFQHDWTTDTYVKDEQEFARFEFGMILRRISNIAQHPCVVVGCAATLIARCTGPTWVPRWALCWPDEPFYLGMCSDL